MSRASGSSKHPRNHGYRYRYDDEYFNPVVDAQKRSPKATREILQDVSNCSPSNGQSWHSIHELLNCNQDGDTKVFFIARHGHSEHNKSQEMYGLDCFNAATELSQAFFDPALTALGQEQAGTLGQILNAVLMGELGADTRDIGFYSSPLHRCISTAEIAARAVFSHGSAHGEKCPTKVTSHQRNRPAVIVLDELREWLGWDHNVATDRRASKTDIRRAFSHSDVDLMFTSTFPEEDVLSQKSSVRESWVEVRRRWERAMDFIFDNDARKYICLFGNNRSLQCGLHALGLPLDARLVEEHKKITVLNFANCAMLALVVRRHPLSSAEAHAKEVEWKDLEQRELDVINALKAKERAAKE